MQYSLKSGHYKEDAFINFFKGNRKHTGHLLFFRILHCFNIILLSGEIFYKSYIIVTECNESSSAVYVRRNWVFLNSFIPGVIRKYTYIDALMSNKTNFAHKKLTLFKMQRKVFFCIDQKRLLDF